MTVAELKEMLTEAPDEMNVFVLGDSALGGFLFLPACGKESGVVDFGEPDQASGEIGDIKRGFVLMACGSTCTEEQMDNMSEGDFPQTFN